MTNPVSKDFPFAGLASYAGAIGEMPNGSFGWTSPNRLRRDGDHLFFERCTVVKAEMADDATLAVVKVEGQVHVYDDNVFMANRWWNYNHLDTYSYPHDYGNYVRSLNRGVERHRDPANGGRIISDDGEDETPAPAQSAPRPRVTAPAPGPRPSVVKKEEPVPAPVDEDRARLNSDAAPQVEHH